MFKDIVEIIMYVCVCICVYVCVLICCLNLNNCLLYIPTPDFLFCIYEVTSYWNFKQGKSSILVLWVIDYITSGNNFTSVTTTTSTQTPHQDVLVLEFLSVLPSFTTTNFFIPTRIPVLDSSLTHIKTSEVKRYPV